MISEFHEMDLGLEFRFHTSHRFSIFIYHSIRLDERRLTVCSNLAQECILLTYCWAHDFTYKQIRNECHSINDTENERLSQETLSDWNNYLREVSVTALDTLYFHHGKIGGPGHIVEIDESKFGKRKFNRGKRVEGTWLLGMIDIGTKEEPNSNGPFQLEICPNNKRPMIWLMKISFMKQ
jgi:hypothetical protein